MSDRFRAIATNRDGFPTILADEAKEVIKNRVLKQFTPPKNKQEWSQLNLLKAELYSSTLSVELQVMIGLTTGTLDTLEENVQGWKRSKSSVQTNCYSKIFARYAESNLRSLWSNNRKLWDKCRDVLSFHYRNANQLRYERAKAENPQEVSIQFMQELFGKFREQVQDSGQQEILELANKPMNDFVATAASTIYSGEPK